MLGKYNKTTYGNLREEDIKYTIITPELSVKDLTKFGAIIKNVADGLVVAESNKWIDKGIRSRKLFCCNVIFR